MHNKIYILLFISFLAISIGCEKSNSPDATSQSQEHYTCPMHLDVKQEGPGQCPICNMNLIKAEGTNESPQSSPEKVIKTNKQHDHLDKTVRQAEAGEIITKVKLKKSQLTHFEPAFFPVTKIKMQKTIRLLGSVLSSENRQSHIAARVDGRIEKVYVQSTGSFIQIGDPVVDLYSPQLITAGQEYLLAKKSHQASPSEDSNSLQNQSEQRLKTWGIKKFQYESWFKKNKIPQKITIYSPARGTVQQKNATVGKYFKEGEHFFELSDLKDIWVEMDVYEHNASLVQLNQTVQMQFTALPGDILSGKIDFIDPILNKNSRTLKIRTTISNKDGKLKPGMVANATLNVQLEEPSLVIPRTAVIDTGKRKVVWTQENTNTFQSKIIHTGHESEGYIEVKAGLVEGEKVVMEGNFLLDAQAQLFGGYENI